MRRKIHSLTFVFMALLMMLMTFASCSKIQDLLNEGDDDDDDDGGINPPELVEGIALSGIVRDASGTPIEGVSIVSGSSAATTNTDGFFEFDQIQVVSVQNDRSVVRFSKAGYFDVVRSMDADDDAADGASWEVVMCKKENNDFTSIKTYSSSSDQTLQAGEMKIDMPQDGYKVDGTAGWRPRRCAFRQLQRPTGFLWNDRPEHVCRKWRQAAAQGWLQGKAYLPDTSRNGQESASQHPFVELQ